MHSVERSRLSPATAAIALGVGVIVGSPSVSARPPYREARNYVSRITSAVDVTPKPKRIYRTIEIVYGREIPRYSTVEAPVAELITTSTTKP